jgi:hypothetical protein
MREAQKRKRFRLSRAALFPGLDGKPSKLDQPSLLRMKFQAELGQSVPKLVQEPLCFHSALEANNKVIGISDDNDFALCPFGQITHAARE